MNNWSFKLSAVLKAINVQLINSNFDTLQNHLHTQHDLLKLWDCTLHSLSVIWP